jgi:hypothetical protein
MARTTELTRARSILGGDVLGPEEIDRAFGAASGLDAALVSTVPFAEERLVSAAQRGELLVLRAASANGHPLTLLRLIERFPDAFDARFLKSMGYQLKSEWGIELEPLAATDTCRAGWALVRKTVLPESCNLSHEEQQEKLAASKEGGVRRRSAVEIAFDLLAFHSARGERLLADCWDWSGSRTIDGGYLNAGHFDERGMQIFSFSPGVRHGKLGLCPNVDPAV